MKKSFISSAIAAGLAAMSAYSNAAIYRVVPITTPDTHANAFARDMNNQGEVVASIRGLDFNTSINNYSVLTTGRSAGSAVNATVLYNHPIDTTQLDLDDEELQNILTDNVLTAYLSGNSDYLDQSVDFTNEVESGRLSLESLSLVTYYLHDDVDNSTNLTRQLDGRYHQIGEYWAAISDGNQLVHQPIQDEINPNTDSYSFEFNESINAINDLGWVVGATESAYQPFSFVDENGDLVEYHVQDNVERGFVKIRDQIIILEPTNTDFRNGRSTATDISNNGYVVGYVSTDFKSDDNSRDSYQNWEIQGNLEACEDRDSNGDYPEEVCHWRLREASFGKWTNAGRSPEPYENLAKTETQVHHAYLWRVNNAGEVIEATDLGVAFNENVNNTYTLYSQAVAVNNNGVAVGRSHMYYSDVERLHYLAAAIFKDGEVETINDNYDDYRSSQATDINNDNVVVGNAQVVVNFNASGVSKAFFYEANKPDAEPVFIDDGQESADTKATAINDAGFVVGSTEVVELVGSSQREHGFIYNINDRTFANLNDLISCDSPYTISSAEAISEDGTILATATVTSPFLDIMGNEVVESDTGEPIDYSYSTVVKLELISGGQAENCVEEGNKVERQGSSFSFGLMTGVFSLLLFRRKFRK